MSNDTRQKILGTAKTMFNERGYNNVSTRDISQKLGISKGNLTYYFKKKEDIIEAIVSESSNTRITDPPESLKELNDFLRDVQNVVQQNSFYFWHHTQLSQVSQKIKDLQGEVFNDNTNILKASLKKLNKAGLLRKEQFKGEYENMVNSLLLSSIYWMPFCRLKDDDDMESKYTEHAWNVIRPLLTTKGKKELDILMQSVE